MSDAGPVEALADIKRQLEDRGVPFALVGGLAVSIRGEVRFTRDVDLAISVANDAEVEALVFGLGSAGYVAVATVEQEQTGRLASVRLISPSGITVDLIAATTGIEPEIVAGATRVRFPDLGEVPVARTEDLIAMKVLSSSERRLQDQLDLAGLLSSRDDLDLERVREMLRLIDARGCGRHQNLLVKLEALMASVSG